MDNSIIIGISWECPVSSLILAIQRYDKDETTHIKWRLILWWYSKIQKILQMIWRTYFQEFSHPKKISKKNWGQTNKAKNIVLVSQWMDERRMTFTIPQTFTMYTKIFTFQKTSSPRESYTPAVCPYFSSNIVGKIFLTIMLD